MTRKTEPPRTEPRKDASDGRADEPPPDKRRGDDAAPADHRFRAWALI